jgi:excisionase family DNA binding protein
MEMVVVTGSELRTLLRGEIADALSRQKSNSLSGQANDQLLKRDDIAKMFGVTLVTVHAWMNAGKIPFHRMGGRVFFKKEEVVESMKAVKLRRKG